MLEVRKTALALRSKLDSFTAQIAKDTRVAKHQLAIKKVGAIVLT